MKIYEIRTKVYLLEDISLKYLSNVLSNFVDSALCKTDSLISFHENRQYKYYCVGNLFPLERDSIYKKGESYMFSMRTADMSLANYLTEQLAVHRNNQMQGLESTCRSVRQKPIDSIATLTPVVIKSEAGYWCSYMTIDDYENRLCQNVIKMYQDFTGKQLDVDADFRFYTNLKFLNKKPIVNPYKNVRLLGDKLQLQIAGDNISQKLAYLLLGTGLGENACRGMGFCNYRYL